VHERAVPRFETWALKLLIADECGPVRERLVGLLTPLVGEVNILQAADVSRALIQIALNRPDVVVLDLDMPGGSGFDVLDAVRDCTRAPLVIVLANYGEPEIRNMCLRRGAHYFLDKSSEFEQVLDIVGTLKQREAASSY
jgi:DNA-binding NarL/FixJ family response regulator